MSEELPELVETGEVDQQVTVDRPIDFVLVYTEPKPINGVSVDNDERCQMRNTFEDTLQRLGMIIEKEPFLEDEYVQFIRPGSNRGTKYFVKLHAPFELLLEVAERTRMKLPVAVNTFNETTPQDWFLSALSRIEFVRKWFLLNPKQFPDNRKRFFTAEYQKAYRRRFEPFFAARNGWGATGELAETYHSYFSAAERSRLVKQILARCPYINVSSPETQPKGFIASKMGLSPKELHSAGLRTLVGALRKSTFNQQSSDEYFDTANSETSDLEDKSENVRLLENVFKFSHVSSRFRGIDNLLALNVYDCAFPLHEPLFKHSTPNSVPERLQNNRMKLYWNWSRFANLFRQQPLMAIRSYFGERIAFYFAWLGWYISMLACPAFLGSIVMLYGMISLYWDIPSSDICNDRGIGATVMCPRPDRRRFWKLSETCSQTRFTYVFDNEASIAFACIMSLWSVLFLCFWEREQNEFRFQWDVHRMVEENEDVRPDYEKRVKTTRFNPTTQQNEPHVSFLRRALVKMQSAFLILFMVAVVCSLLLGVIVYRLSIKTALSMSNNKFIRTYSPYIVSSTAAVINLFCIITLSFFYERLAVFFTDLELHKTDHAYEDSLTLKLFIFQFINYYSSLFYIALFKPSYTNRPGSAEYMVVGKYRTEECDFAGCMNELAIQLVIIMVGKQLISNVWELSLVKLWNVILKRCFMRESFKIFELRRKIRKRNTGFARRPYEEDMMLISMSATTLFYEYLELVIQYGFITMFIVAFPLAPVFSLINNLMEVRVDASKFVTEMQRPVARRSNGIGIWQNILRGISRLALLTNALLIAFASDTIPRQVYKYLYSNDGTLRGYVNFTLSIFDVSHLAQQDLMSINNTDNLSFCRYKDYRYPPGHPKQYDRSRYFYQIMSIKLVFVLVFECTCSLLIGFIDFLVTRLPTAANAQANHERNIVQNMHWEQIGDLENGAQQSKAPEFDQKQAENFD